ncbi:hypothetical protein [Shewanella halifaxensis]|nr:hypothetical protein [Shewanella halifaxensis]
MILVRVVLVGMDLLEIANLSWFGLRLFEYALCKLKPRTNNRFRLKS